MLFPACSIGAECAQSLRRPLPLRAGRDFLQIIIFRDQLLEPGLAKVNLKATRATIYPGQARIPVLPPRKLRTNS